MNSGIFVFDSAAADKLIQRLPLMIVAGGICFLLGIVVGLGCTFTILRGFHRRQKGCKPKKETATQDQDRPHIVNSELDTHGRSSPRAEVSLAMPQCDNPHETPAPRIDPVPDGATGCSVATPQTNRDSCAKASIDIDLDELERAVALA